MHFTSQTLLKFVTQEVKLVLLVLLVLYTTVSQTVSLLVATLSIIWHQCHVPAFPLVATIVLQPHEHNHCLLVAS